MKKYTNLIILALFILFVMAMIAKGQDSTSVWMQSKDLSQYFRAKLEEENKRHAFVSDSIRIVHIQNTAFIQGQMSVTGAIVDSVKVKK